MNNPLVDVLNGTFTTKTDWNDICSGDLLLIGDPRRGLTRIAVCFVEALGDSEDLRFPAQRLNVVQLIFGNPVQTTLIVDSTDAITRADRRKHYTHADLAQFAGIG